MSARFAPLFVLVFVSMTVGWSQISQPSRHEITLEDETNEINQRYSVVNLREDGLMIYRRVMDRKESKVELTRLDTTMTRVWKGVIEIQNGYQLLHSEYKGEFLFLLFKDQYYLQGDFIILAIRIGTGDYGTYVVKNLIPFNPTEFIITNEAALIGGYFNYRPIVLHFGFASQQSRLLPGFFNDPGDLTQIAANADGTIDVIVSARNLERRRVLTVRNYDGQGNLIKTVVLTPDERKNLIYGRTVRTHNGVQVVAGVYGRSPEYSRGIFVARINEVGEYGISYYNFADLQRFFGYMRPRREQRVKNRIDRKKMKGKNPKFNYRLLVHELIPYGEDFIMLGEAFFPHYSYPNSRNMGLYMMPTARFYNNPMVRGELVFDGYQYTHATLISFDKDGQLKWDNSFEINDVRTFQLQQYVKIIPQHDRILLFYLFDNVIHSKIIKNSEVLEGKSFDQLKMQFSQDVVKPRNTEKTTLEHWYGEVLYATGIQTIQSGGSKSEVHSRRVFFINKIVYK